MGKVQSMILFHNFNTVHLHNVVSFSRVCMLTAKLRGSGSNAKPFRTKMALFVMRRSNFFASKLLLTAAAAISVAPKLILAELCTNGAQCSDEVQKAKLASEAAEKYRPEDSIFSKIIRKEVPADIIYEDEKVGALSLFDTV